MAASRSFARTVGVGTTPAAVPAARRRREESLSPGATLAETAAGEVARCLRLMGHPVRVRLLALLRGGPLTVSELRVGVGVDGDTASKHLGVLLRAGLVRRRQDGVYGRYELADADVLGMLVLARRVTQGNDRRLAELLRELDLDDDGDDGKRLRGAEGVER